MKLIRSITLPLLLIAPLPAQGTVEYGVISLGSGTPVAINSSGAIAGNTLVAATNVIQPYVWDDGIRVVLPVPAGYQYAYARDISDEGVVVGFARKAWNDIPGDMVRWVDGVPEVLPGINGYPAQPRGINSAGTIVGGANNGSFLLGAFVYDDVNGISNLPVNSPATDINNQGLILGGAFGSAWTWDPLNGQQFLDPVPSPFAYAYPWAINEVGQVSALLEVPGGNSETLARWDPVAGWLVIGGSGDHTVVGGINVHGDVVGQLFGVSEGALYTDLDGLRLLEALVDPAAGVAIRTGIDIDDHGNILASEDTGLLLVELTGKRHFAVSYCDGTTGCPCGNTGFAGAGCANSVGSVTGTLEGARLLVEGSASVAADDLHFVGLDLPIGMPGVLFAGTTATSLPFGDGLRCVAGTTQRLGVSAAQDSGDGLHGVATWSPSAASGGWSAGSTRHFQIWYRDPAGPCGSTFNLSGALTIGFTP